MNNIKMFNSLNLNNKFSKIKSEDSERIVDPKITCDLAIKKLESINCKYDVEFYNIDNIFYSSELFYKNIYDLDLAIQPAGPLNGGFSSMGKGTTPEQCKASMYMETIERISLWQHMNSFFPIYPAFNLRTKQIDKVAVDTTNSEMVAAGNSYEEAILHGLHEMIENESVGKAGLSNSGGSITADLKPYKVVDFSSLFPEWPEWVHSSFTVLQVPTLVSEFYSFIGLRYPINPNYTNDWHYIIDKNGVYSKQVLKFSNWRGNKAAYAFTAAGINPKKAISRCIQENFQGPERYKYYGKKKDIPDWIQIIDATTFENYETTTIEDDIDFIISHIPNKFNVWAVDLTSPELGVPVVKIVTDYHQPIDVGQERISNLFYEA